MRNAQDGNVSFSLYALFGYQSLCYTNGYLHCLILQYHSPEESHEPRLKSVSAYFLCVTLVKTPDDQTLSTQKRIHTCHKQHLPQTNLGSILILRSKNITPGILPGYENENSRIHNSNISL